MTVDLSKLKVGDTVRQRDGERKVVTKIERTTVYTYTTRVNGYLYTESGAHWNGLEEPEDIVEIIPKEKPFMKEYPAEIIEKPKRFVDLLSEDVEYIECNSAVWRVNSNRQLTWFDVGTCAWVLHRDDGQMMFEPATPAQNPERKKKVVYNVLMYSEISKSFYVTQCKFASIEECAKEFVNSKPIRLIEESREEIGE